MARPEGEGFQRLSHMSQAVKIAVCVHRGSMLWAQLEMPMAGLPPSQQAMLQRPGMEMAGPQAMASTQGMLTRQLRMAPARMPPQGSQGPLQAMMPPATVLWAGALRWTTQHLRLQVHPRRLFLPWQMPSSLLLVSELPPMGISAILP